MDPGSQRIFTAKLRQDLPARLGFACLRDISPYCMPCYALICKVNIQPYTVYYLLVLVSLAVWQNDFGIIDYADVMLRVGLNLI
jgi:hypothetical protein